MPGLEVPYQLDHASQHAIDQISGFYNSLKRFNIAHSGRRSYKTLTSKKRLKKRLLGAHDPISPHYIDGNDRPNFFCGAPTQDQTHRVFWEDMYNFIGKEFITKTNESKHFMELINGPRLYVLGLDAPARWEGIMMYGGIIDEFGNAKPDILDKHIFPMMSDTKGWIDFTGVPEGTGDHYHKLKCDAERFPEDWAIWHWKSAEVLDPKEVAAAKERMDESTFRQEYEGDFVSWAGKAYYPFDKTAHCHPIVYDPKDTLYVQFDFNISPGVAVFCQEIGAGNCPSLPNFTETGYLNEVFIAKDSNTELVCAKAIQLFRSHQGRIVLDGDATGGARHSSSDKTNWQIILNMFKHAFPGRIDYAVPKGNPYERDRINAVNSRLKSMDGQIHIVIDPRCKHLIEDLDGVGLDKNGQLDDKTNPMLTHISDAMGYYIARRFPLIKYVETSLKHWK